MKSLSEEIIKSSNGNCDIINITDDVIETLRKFEVKNGLCTILSIGSPAGITTIEYEPGLIKDLPKLLEKIIPSGARYHHDNTWGDGNGHAHLRSALFKTSLSVPFVKGDLTLGTWQQIILVDFDNRKRTRRIVVQFIGE